MSERKISFKVGLGKISSGDDKHTAEEKYIFCYYISGIKFVYPAPVISQAVGGLTYRWR